MSFDTLTVSAIRDELRSHLLGGRVQRIVRPSELSLGLEIFTGERRQLLLSAEPADALVLMTEEKPRRGVEAPSPLQLLLRKYVRGARLVEIGQPDLERILLLHFEGELGPVTLVCEIMGRLSNLILLAPDGTIMEAAKRVSAAVNRYRTILPAHPYIPPPPQEKEHPRLLTTTRLAALLAESEARVPVWRRLLQGVMGLSPLLAREIVYRATGGIEPADPLTEEALSSLVMTTVAMFRLPEDHGWQASAAPARGEPAGSPLREYAPYLLTHLPGYLPFATLHEAIQAVRAAEGSVDPYARVRQRLRDAIRERIARLEARLASQRAALVPKAELELLQLKGNAVLAMGWSLKPRQTELILSPADLMLEGDGLPEVLHIALDPALSPAENAQAYFEEYRKRKGAYEQVPQLIADTETELAYMRQLLADVGLAEDRAQLDEVRAEMEEAGIGAARGKKRPAPGEPLTFRGLDGTPILVGRNSRQNDLVTFRLASPDDIWLHAHGVPGSHVIIKSAGRPVTEGTLTQAARLAAYYSAARSEKRVQVDYTPRRHVRHIKGAPAGMVTYTHEETLVVEPERDAGE